jgi:hypothetical protein
VNVCHAFHSQDVLRQGALTPLLLKFAFRVRRCEGSRKSRGLELNGTHRFLVNADDSNFLVNVKVKLSLSFN